MMKRHLILVLVLIIGIVNGQQSNQDQPDIIQEVIHAQFLPQGIRFLQQSSTTSSQSDTQVTNNNQPTVEAQRLTRQQAIKKLQDQLGRMNLEGDISGNQALKFGSQPQKATDQSAISNTNDIQKQPKTPKPNNETKANPSSQTTNGQQLIKVPEKPANTQPVTPEPPKILVAQIDATVVGKGFKIDNGVSYQRIKLGNLQKKYLFFDLKLSNEWQPIKVVISKEGSNVKLADCMFQSQSDGCYIAREKLQVNSTLFVGIQCSGDCTYSLKARWSDLQMLQFGKELVFVFGEDKTQLFQLNLEKDETFQQIRIHLTTRTTLKPFSNAKMYVKFGNKNPTEEDFDVKSYNLWQDGQGIFLTKRSFKQKTLMLLLIGQDRTTYRLTCQKVQDSIHQISNYDHIYEYIEDNSMKEYFVQKINSTNITEYSFKFSILSGEAQVRYFADQAMKKALPLEPYEYMKDTEYVIPASQLQDIKKGIYIRVTSKTRAAMYTLKYVARQNNVPIELNQHVYGFVPFLPINKVRYAYFNYKQWVEQTDIKSSIKFTVNLIHVAGRIQPEFKLCKGEIFQCTNAQTSDQFTTPLATKSSNYVSQKQTLELEISESLFKEINNVQRQANIIVKFDSKSVGNDTFELVAIEFINKKKVLYLRENRPLEESLYDNESRHYKYVNSDLNVVEIRVFVNVIQGKINLEGSTANRNSINPLVHQQANTLIFTKDLDKPLLIIVNALTKSIYGIHLQIVHKDNPFHNANFYTIGEDLVYNVKIKPLTYSIFEVVPMFNEFYFTYESSQSVIACVINQTLNQCLDITQDEIPKPKISVKETITNVTIQNRKAQIKITNPFSDSIAAVSVIFHSKPLDHCLTKKLGQVYNDLVSSGQCYEYDVDETQNNTLELYVSKRQFLNLAYTVYLCENSIQKSMNQKIIRISPETVRQVCTKDRHKLLISWHVLQQEQGQASNKVKVDFVAQYEGSSILLPEGLSYSVLEPARPNFIKTFRYNLINQYALKVILRQTRGFLMGYAKLTSIKKEFSQTLSNVDFAYSTDTNVDYNLQPTILISQEEIKSKNITEAVLIIAIYADNQDNAQFIDFDIQVVQKYEILTENNALAGFLQAGSLAYYTYQASSQQDTTIFVTVSDHNTLCTNIYLSYSQNVGPKSSVDSAFNRDFLPIVHKAGTKKYFIAIEATKICDYSLEVFSIDTSINYLQRGRQRTIRILKDTVRYFIFQSHNEAFKIFTMLKFGQVRYYLHRSANGLTKRTFTVSQLDYKTFQYTSSQLNTIYIDEKSTIFCKDCHYFLAVEALQNTEGTLVLSSPINVITLPKNKYFSDVLHEKDTFTILSYKFIEKTNLKITVHKGQIQLIAHYLDENFDQLFKAKSDHQSMILNFKGKQLEKNVSVKTNSPSRKSKVPINIFIKGISDLTSYTIRASRSQDAQKITLTNTDLYFHDIVPGEPNHISLVEDTVTCIKGYLRDVNETISITSNSKNNKHLENLVFDTRLNDEPAGTEITYIKNMINLRLKKLEKKDKGNSTNTTAQATYFFGSKYQVCLKFQLPQYKEDQALKDQEKSLVQQGTNVTDENTLPSLVFNIIVTQINSVNLLASDTETLVKGDATYIIHSQGQFILDILECSGTAKLAYGKNLKDIQQKNLLNLEAHSVSEQSHALKVSVNENTIYVKVSTQLSVLRWLPLDYETDQGTGYIRFSAGNFRYSSEFKKIKLQYQQLQMIKKSKSTVKHQEYILILADSEQKLEKASKCQDYGPGVVQVTLSKADKPYSVGSEDYKSFTLDKDKLQLAFSNSSNIYINIVVKLVLELSEQAEKNVKFLSPSSDDDQHYRFIYNKQQIPLVLFKQSQIQSIPYHYLFLSIFSIAAVFLLLTYVFTRKIVPLIARLKNSNLVQENDGVQERQDDLQVPASSDRNQRAIEPVIETDQRMNN